MIDSDVQFSATRHDPELDPDTIGQDGCPYPAAVRPPCMVGSHETRTAYIRLRDGDSDVGGIATPVQYGAEWAERGVEKYGRPTVLVGVRNALDYVEPFADLGEKILASGEEHGWFSFYYRGPYRIHAEVLAARDKSDKYVLAQHVAETVARVDADGIVQIGEIWMGKAPETAQDFVPASEQPDRTEALQVYAEIASGETRGMIIPFSRSAFGIVSIGDRFEENTPSNFLLPVRETWRAARREGAPGARLT